MNGKSYVIYVDVFFLINFIMDYIVIKLTAMVMKHKCRRIRICAACAVGAFYSVVILKPLLNHLPGLTLISIFISFLMILIAFGYRDLITYFKNVIFLTVVSFLLSGVMNYIYYSTRIGSVINETLHGTSNKSMNTRKFVAVTVIAYYIMVFVIRFVTAHKRDMNLIYEVMLSYNGKSVVAKALLDTGNSLKAPLTKEMVHIAEYKIIRPMLKGDEVVKDNLMVIPFQSVGEENGILYALKMDEMVVVVDGIPQFVRSPIVAIYHGELSKSDKFSMILNRDTLESKNSLTEV
ncbi:MAG: sigma-E processing peptidase SpoIIGA [Lachnospiraceae bacterium]|nr:sigma-E processing peptidase SpoIIGA [Lachnospiraceae bacterium]